jgi:uncharacterized protein YkwD
MNGKSHRLLAALILTCASPVILGSTDLTSNRATRLLAAHNRERDTAGLPLLKWDDRLMASSRGWAEHLQRIGTLVHYESHPKDPDPEGENLWAGTRGYYSPEAMVGLWIAEKKHFKPGLFPRNSKTGRVDDVGHYTQVMWRSTTHVGCAVSANRKEEFLVCRYSEGGNVIGEQPF